MTSFVLCDSKTAEAGLSCVFTKSNKGKLTRASAGGLPMNLTLDYGDQYSGRAGTFLLDTRRLMRSDYRLILLTASGWCNLVLISVRYIDKMALTNMT